MKLQIFFLVLLILDILCNKLLNIIPRQNILFLSFRLIYGPKVEIQYLMSLHQKIKTWCFKIAFYLHSFIKKYYSLFPFF